MGWERPNWFAKKGVEAKDIYSFDRQNWFVVVGEEVKRLRVWTPKVDTEVDMVGAVGCSSIW